jgi:hypothetical protein
VLFRSANFTNISTSLVKGTAYTITINPGWSSSARSEAYRVWIDYNGDGDFVDAGEQVFNRTKTNVNVVSGTFTVPTSAISGTTRMRVSMKYNASPTSCETFASGEVEDYTINLVSNTGQDYNGYTVSEPMLIFTEEVFEEEDANELTDSDELTQHISVYPNPLIGDKLFVSTYGFEAEEVFVFNILGELVLREKIIDSGVNVSSLSVGVYIIQAKKHDGVILTRFVKN